MDCTSRQVATTRSPALSARCASVLPMPEAAPVMNQTRLLSFDAIDITPPNAPAPQPESQIHRQQPAHGAGAATRESKEFAESRPRNDSRPWGRHAGLPPKPKPCAG